MAEAKFNFNDLFILEMANNHQGTVSHGKLIIDEMSKVVRQYGVRAGVKLQFRELDTFVHPDFKNSTSNKHIPRFMGTRLTEAQFGELVTETKNQGLITICTPFDEASVDQINRLGIEVIKIGSCSAKDWPLLEKVATAGKPVIYSTAGLTIADIDKAVSFFQHRGVHFAVMHCVGIYPTPSDKLGLNQIEMLRNRYPGVTIGFSTHEDPSNYNNIRVAYAKGARIFEKHVGVATDTIKLNAYSANPEQVSKWMAAYSETAASCGDYNRPAPSKEELESLESLMRGVYAKEPIARGEVIDRNKVFFAMPLQTGGVSSGEWKEGLVADRDYGVNLPMQKNVLENKPISKREIIYPVIHEVKGMLNMARIPLGYDFSVELSHHYGMENFRAVGALLIDCINREYCKKIIVQLPNQRHPSHYHKKKEETFQMLYGILEVDIEGRHRTLYPGDTLVVPRGVWHSFWTPSGAIFEEVSTTHLNDDSFYEDKDINKLAREDRKTKLTNWGRNQFE